MPHLHATILRSTDALRSMSAAWDTLWSTSAVTVPLLRAEALAQWYEHFTPRSAPTIVVIHDGAQLVAALPLASSRVGRIVPCGAMTNDPWSLNGDLLLDDSAHSDESLDLLVATLERLPWPVHAWESIPLEAPHWQQFRAAARRRGWRIFEHADDQHGCITIDDWERYEASWSASHRRHQRRAWKAITRDGGASLRIVDRPSVDDVVGWVERCFALEDRGWKRVAGTSVLATPGKLAYFTKLAQAMATWGHLHLALLEFRGEPISFEFGFVSKGVYFSPKIGYDEEFRRYSPGQLLFHALLKALHDRGDVTAVDTWGPLTEASAKWTTHSYMRGKLVLAPPRTSSRLLFHALLAGRRAVRAWCGRRDPDRLAEANVEEPQLV